MEKVDSGEVMLAATQFIRSQKYWLEKLAGELVKSNFPSDRINSGQKTAKRDILNYKVSKDLVSKITQLSGGSNLKLYIILVSGLMALLHKCTGNEDIIVGAPIYKQDFEGEFINTIVTYRNNLTSETTFKQLLISVRQIVIEAGENQNYSLESLLKELNQPFSEDSFPLFNTVILLQNIHDQKYVEHTNPDLIFSFLKTDNDLEGAVEYNPLFYHQAGMEKNVNRLILFMERALENIDLKIGEIEFITSEEKQRFFEFNQTKTEYFHDKTVPQLFEEQVERTPANIAVVYENEKLTFRELNQKANQVARLLREKGIMREQVIGIMTERSLEMIIGTVGILKAGGAYLPLDSLYPEERIRYMLEDSRVSFVLSGGELSLSLLNSIILKMTNEATPLRIVNLKDERIYQRDHSNLKIVNTPQDLAYVIFTSGSTGKPKGVMIEHRSVINLVAGLFHSIYKTHGTNLNVAFVAPFVFDASVQQIFASLFLGHKLFIVPEDVRIDGEKLLQFLASKEIEITDGTPTHLSIMLNTNPRFTDNLHLKHLIIGGETLTYKTAIDFRNRCGENKPLLTNIYGPTECCVDSTVYTIETEHLRESSSIPIGAPMVNIRIYIVGKNLEILPVGVMGEIYIAGDGVGRGYQNNPEKTASQFLPDPFFPGARMYRTEDFGIRLPEGVVEFAGRADDQVKIRGYRIELKEIENQLLKHPMVNQAAVIVKVDQNGNKSLGAYFVSNGELVVDELKKYLSIELPGYMIPSYFIKLEHMPVMSNGKIDRKRLLDLGLNDPESAGDDLPQSVLEVKLINIWRRVLGTERIRINDNFFEIGGDSLKASLLVSWIHKELQIAASLREVFHNPTIKEFTEYLSKERESIYSSIEPAPEMEYYPSSPAQKRFYIISQIYNVGTSYNSLIVNTIEGNLDLGRFEKAIKGLINRHESLRSSFKMIESELYQKIHQQIDFKIQYWEYPTRNITELINDFCRPFIMSEAPLFRIGLIKQTDHKFILLFETHHIVTDAVSLGIIIREFINLYEGKTLPNLRLQYKDFSVWQKAFLKSDTIRRQEEYWLSRFGDQIPLLNLPTDFPRLPVRSFAGATIFFILSKELTDKTRQIAIETGTTLYIFFLAVLNVLLFKYTGQEDIIVGSPVAGRSHLDLEKIIGVFINDLAIRNFPVGRKTFREFLEEVKENALTAYENQDYRFEELVDKLGIKRDSSRNPLYDVLFVMQNVSLPEVTIEGLNFTVYQYENKYSQMDFSLEGFEGKETISFKIDYDIKLFKKETMENLGGHFLNIVQKVIENLQIYLVDLEILTEVEKEQIIDKLKVLENGGSVTNEKKLKTPITPSAEFDL